MRETKMKASKKVEELKLIIKIIIYCKKQRKKDTLLVAKINNYF
jgi:hypothetical protein